MESREEGLVEPSPRVLVPADVQPGAVLEKPKGDLQALLDERMVDARELDQALGITLLDGERFLPLFQVGVGR